MTELKILTPNSKKLLNDIIQSENPTQLLCDRFKNLSFKENDELRSLVHELCQAEYIKIPLWADNMPCHVVVNESARIYDELLAEYEKKRLLNRATYIGTINDQSVKLGNGNKIINSNIGGENELYLSRKPINIKKTFYEKHPVICGFLISLVAGIVMLFSFWSKIIEFIEGVL